MTVKMSHSKTKRRFVRPTGMGGSYNKILFLVYKIDSHGGILSTEGPFEERELADAWMREKLLEGICAWVVSYNG